MNKLTAALMALCVLSAGAAYAGADQDIKYRKGVMKAIGGSVGNIAAILKGEAGDTAHMPYLIAILSTAAKSDMTTAAFKPNTDGKGEEKTTATGKIWSDWAKFEAGLKKLEETTSVVAAKAAAGEEIWLDDMKPVFGACKACHDDFRKK